MRYEWDKKASLDTKPHGIDRTGSKEITGKSMKLNTKFYWKTLLTLNTFVFDIMKPSTLKPKYFEVFVFCGELLKFKPLVAS